MLITSEAIVLRSRKYSDTSKIVTLYIKETGKTTLLAKGARQSKNKFGTGLDPMNIVNVTFYKNSQKELHLLSKVEPELIPKGITESFDCLTSAMAILESVIQTQDDEEANSDLYQLVEQKIRTLNEKGHDPFSVFCRFQYELAGLMGFDIEFPNTAISGEKSQSGTNKQIILSLENGCSCAGNMMSHCFSISTDLFNYLFFISKNSNMDSFANAIMNTNFQETKTLLNSAQRTVIINFWRKYFSFHLDKNIDFRSLSLYGA